MSNMIYRLGGELKIRKLPIPRLHCNDDSLLTLVPDPTQSALRRHNVATTFALKLSPGHADDTSGSPRGARRVETRGRHLMPFGWWPFVLMWSALKLPHWSADNRLGPS